MPKIRTAKNKTYSQIYIWTLLPVYLFFCCTHSQISFPMIRCALLDVVRRSVFCVFIYFLLWFCDILKQMRSKTCVSAAPSRRCFSTSESFSFSRSPMLCGTKLTFAPYQVYVFCGNEKVKREDRGGMTGTVTV